MNNLFTQSIKNVKKTPVFEQFIDQQGIRASQRQATACRLHHSLRNDLTGFTIAALIPW